MGLIDYQRPERLEGSWGKWPLAQSLNHCDNKIIVDRELVTLDPSYGRARAELLDAFYPLICQESLVDYDERASLKLSSERQGADRFAQSYVERKDAISRLDSLSDSFDLMSSKAPSKINISGGPFGSWGWTPPVLVKPGNTNRSLL
jgi:hypothetical protein